MHEHRQICLSAPPAATISRFSATIRRSFDLRSLLYLQWWQLFADRVWNFEGEMNAFRTVIACCAASSAFAHRKPLGSPAIHPSYLKKRQAYRRVRLRTESPAETSSDTSSNRRSRAIASVNNQPPWASPFFRSPPNRVAGDFPDVRRCAWIIVHADGRTGHQ
jgi:hypothetical protein